MRALRAAWCVLSATALSACSVSTHQATTHDAHDDETQALCRALHEGPHHALWQSYTDAPDVHPNLPNVSFAGYRYGDALPDTSELTRVDVTDYGAKRDGSNDASDAVDAAMRALPNAGGVVHFPAGDYRLSRPIVITRSHVVLEGDGAEDTRLSFTRSLNDGYGSNVDPLGKSRWSWTGGMIWFSPRAQRHHVSRGDLSEAWQEGWSALDAKIAIVGNSKRGDRVVRVQDPSTLRAAQLMLIELDTSEALHKHLSGDGVYADAQDWSESGAGAILPPAQPTMVWPVSIRSIEGDALTLQQPLRFDLRAEWSPRVRAVAEVITDSGVRDLSIVLGRTQAYDRKKDHHREVGWNGLLFENALHCFADNIRVIDAENAIGVVASKNITVRAFSIDASNDSLRTQHHATVTRVFSNDILFEDFVINAQPTHGLNVEGFSMGNVWSRGRVAHGTWDLHRALPVDNLLTEVEIHNDGGEGGRSNAGPAAGARHVIWNVHVTNGDCDVIGEPSLLPNGAIVGLRGCAPTDIGDSGCLLADSGETGRAPTPANLYEAQRTLRMCGAQAR